ncbi:MAG: aminotransferase class V-fold PLP-dependent enzyme [Candidatus Thorarchaeota archaeon]
MAKIHVYLDNSATTVVSDEVLNVMKKFLINDFGNSSSTYQIGSTAKEALERSREIIAESISARPSRKWF